MSVPYTFTVTAYAYRDLNSDEIEQIESHIKDRLASKDHEDIEEFDVEAD